MKENDQENKTLLSQSIDAKLSQMEEENRQERTHSNNKKKKAVTLIMALVILMSMVIGIISRG